MKSNTATGARDVSATNLTASTELKSALNSKERARRFSLQMPMRYRLNGQRRWWKGTTNNVSRSGVLFQGELAAVPNTAVEISKVLPAEVSGNGGTEVPCKASVVRTMPRAGGGLSQVAATISHCRAVGPRFGLARP